MNNIVIPNYYKQKDNAWFIDRIEFFSNKVEFSYNINNIDLILKHIIKQYNMPHSYFKQKQILYLIFSLLKNNNYQEPFGIDNDNGRPILYNKYTFTGDYRKTSLGIYHAHISDVDKDVLIWYFTLDYDGQLDIHFEYMLHPKKYEPILKKIYEIENGFNMDEGEFFENLNYLFESKILNFNDFLLEQFVKEENKYIYYNVYTLSEHTDDSASEIYGVWDSRDGAISEAKSHFTNYEDENSDIHMDIRLLKIPIDEILKYHDINKKEFIDDKDFYIFSYIENNDIIMQYTVDVETEHILHIPYDNKSTDDMIDEVIDKLNVHFHKSWKNGFKKYTYLYKDNSGNLTFDSYDYDYDGNEIENEPIKIRIADHSHNPSHGQNDLNVLISNKDATDHRFHGKTHLIYNENDDVDDIVNDILNYWK